jgi:hypothetical protein
MMNEIKEYLRKLLKGNVSLFISFWFWFIGLSFFMEIFFQVEFNQNPFVHNNFLEFLLFILMLMYSVLIFMIIFRSANNYKGSRVWSFIAKTIVTINLFFSLSFSIDTIKFYFLEDYAIEKEIEDFKASLPMQVDSVSVLIDIYKKNKTIFYNYQLFDVSLEKDVDKNRFEKQIQNSLCEDETSLNLLKKNYILDYEYINEKEERVINIQTNKEDCGKSIYDLEILKEVLQKQKIF